jgi:DNA replication licensing factor MCM6
MPRCIDVICRNEVVETAKAGDKIVFTGTTIIIPDIAGQNRIGENTVSGKFGGSRGENTNEGVSGLKRLGVKEMTYRMLFIASAIQQHREGHHNKLDKYMTGSNGIKALGDSDGVTNDITNNNDIDNIPLQFTEMEHREIIEIRNTSHLYMRMIDSICPTVYGHAEVKRGILLMMLGGVHKTTPEGISLRGDLNVCIVGDPSCAKSQFLKYVHEFLPRSVYTSGKASSAAGLTATVVKDSETGEFCVEAGNYYIYIYIIYVIYILYILYIL